MPRSVTTSLGWLGARGFIPSQPRSVELETKMIGDVSTQHQHWNVRRPLPALWIAQHDPSQWRRRRKKDRFIRRHRWALPRLQAQSQGLARDELIAGLRCEPRAFGRPRRLQSFRRPIRRIDAVSGWAHPLHCWRGSLSDGCNSHPAVAHLPLLSHVLIRADLDGTDAQLWKDG